MPIDVSFHLDRLRCLTETDGNGHSEPYAWTVLLWADDTTIGTPALLGSNAPGNVEGGRIVIKEGIRAGEEAPMPAAQASFAHHRFEDGLDMRRIALVVAMLERDDTPDRAIRAAYDAFRAELPRAVGAFLMANMREPTREEIQLVAAQIQPVVIAAARDALSAFEKLQVILGNLQLDDALGFDSTFINLDDADIPTNFTLRFVTETPDRVVTNEYELDGRLELQTPTPPEACQPQIDAVKQAQALVKGLQAEIKGLQEELKDAPPPQKGAINKQIRKIKEEELPAAAKALDKARDALAACRG